MKTCIEYLTSADRITYNVANVSSVSELNPGNVLEYVQRCLSIAEKDTCHWSDQKARYIVEQVLMWMDVAKGGNEFDREYWKERLPEICLDVHNEASAMICGLHHDERNENTEIIRELIRTHGLIGQCLMGECDLSAYAALERFKIDKARLTRILRAINHAIIGGVSESLWDRIETKVYSLINDIVNQRYEKFSVLQRLKLMFPAFAHVEKLTNEEINLYSTIFNNAKLWYPSIALKNFSRIELNTIFNKILDCDIHNIKDISFYEFSKAMAYDRNGKLRENVYKKRILEVLLREMSDRLENTCEKEHVCISCIKDGSCLVFKVEFTPVCEALINFCMEAEKSGFADYQKNIITIFDIFGFRRDYYDYLTNEEDYLETMNNAHDSTKLHILNYVNGDVVIDVGSGGGVLLDEMEKRFPDKTIIGTDVSEDVIEHLERKIIEGGHKYTVVQHDFSQSRNCFNNNLHTYADNIIFSSILHEIYSYSYENGTERRFSKNTVIRTLTRAACQLKKNGRFIIRDGVLTNSERIVSIRIKDKDLLGLALNYLKDFQGLEYLRDENGWKNVTVEGDMITADINLIREMLFTITWGAMSYPREVQEQFGYFTLDEYKQVLNDLNMRIITAEEFIEPGYIAHLNEYVDLIDFDWNDIPSTCIIVAEKGDL